jgi:hypothetical protein
MCRDLEDACILHEAVDGLEMSRTLRRFRMNLQHVTDANKVQATLFNFYPKK